MYRAIGFLALRNGQLDSEANIVQTAMHNTLDFDWSTNPPTLTINGTRYSKESLEVPDVAMAASTVARLPAVRAILVNQQRRIGREKVQLISEGRDQGSVVFEDAGYKFYLTALVTVRATRRFMQEMEAWRRPDGSHRHKRPEYLDTLHDLIKRDHQDMTSKVGRLVVPTDAIIVDSSEIEGVEKVVDNMMDAMQG
jgi:CMP/dCMP kinase